MTSFFCGDCSHAESSALVLFDGADLAFKLTSSYELEVDTG